MDCLKACILCLLGCVKICNKCASSLPTWLRQIIANGFRCLFIIALWLHHFFLFFPPPDDQWSTAASITSGVFIWCRLWSGYQLGGEVINYPTLSIKRRGYQLSHVINYPLDDLSSEPIMENRPNHVLAKPTLTPPHPSICCTFTGGFPWTSCWVLLESSLSDARNAVVLDPSRSIMF